MIRELPQVLDLGVSENSRGQAGGSGNIVYGNTINLRGIGPYATLVLIDGHRVVNNSRSTDPSVLPSLGRRADRGRRGRRLGHLRLGRDRRRGQPRSRAAASNGVEAFARGGTLR